jgi:hypothetical protein
MIHLRRSFRARAAGVDHEMRALPFDVIWHL